MNIKNNCKLLSIALLCALTASNVPTHATSSPAIIKERVENSHLNIRKKYSSAASLKRYGITYQQLNNIITETSEKLLKQHAPCCSWCRFEPALFERALEEYVLLQLEQCAAQHHAIKDLSNREVGQRIEAHELKLRQQYGKPEQLQYYKVRYQEVLDIIREVSRSMFGSRDNSMTTTESHLNELFRMHTDAVLEKLRVRRECRS